MFNALLIIFFSLLPFSLVSMEKANSELTDILPIVIVQKPYEHPWDNFIHAKKLGRVCKAWYAVVSDTEQLAQQLDIPPMHCAAMMNDPRKIVELKLAGYSPLAPNMQEHSPARFAIECRQYDALRMLAIGSMVGQDDIEYVPAHDKEALRIFNPGTSKHTKEDLDEAVKLNDYKKVITILTGRSGKLHPDHIDKAEALGFTHIAHVMRYALQCDFEHLFFVLCGYVQNLINEEHIRFFLRVGANPNAYNEDGATILHMVAFQKVLFPTMQKLLQLKGIDINTPHLTQGYNALYLSAHGGNLAGLTELVKIKKLKGESFSRLDNEALIIAIKNKHIDCVQFLIKNSDTINYLDQHGNSPLHQAAADSAECLAAVMNAPQCNLNIINTDGFTPLMQAVLSGPVECMDLLIMRGADATITIKTCSPAPHLVGGTVMHLAALGRPDCLVKLVERFKGQINDKTISGRTPLMYAVSYNKVSCIHLLLMAGADVNATDIDGDTVLHCAASQGFAEVVELLLTQGADINRVNNPGNVSVDDTHQSTPLHYAVRKGHLEVVKILLKYGADITLKTQSGKTALDLACEYNHPKIKALLKSENCLLM